MSAAPPLSQQGLILYKRMLDDTVFIKRQMWTTTNYAALIYAAIIFLDEKLTNPQKLFCILALITILTAAIAVWLLLRFQYDLYKLRGRIDKISNYCFIDEERSALSIEPDKDPLTRGWEILFSLSFVCAAGCALVLLSLR